MNAIEIRNLSKSFRNLYAVDGLNMTVPMGAIYGFIGENGSGKSTTEKLMLQLPTLLTSYQWARTEAEVESFREKIALELNELGRSIDLLTIQ